MMFPGWYVGNGGMSLVSLADTSAVAMVLVVTALLTLALLAVLGVAAFSNTHRTSGLIRPPRRRLAPRRHAWAGAHR